VRGLGSQEALDQAQPGDIIELGDGQYWEDPKTRVRRSTSSHISCASSLDFGGNYNS